MYRSSFTLSIKLTGFLFIGIVTFLYMGCQSTNKNNTPKPTTGSITGTITPTDGVISVVAKPTVVGQSSSVSVDPIGNFEIDNLSPGSYSVTVYPGPGFLMPNSINTTVIAGQPSNVGTIVMPLDPTGGVVSYTIDGTSYNITSNDFISCGYTKPTFGLSAQTANLKLSDGFIVSFILGDVNGPGTYSITGANSSARIGQYSGTNIYFWSTLRGGAIGTVTLSTLNTTTHRTAGTFTLTLVPESLLETTNKTVTGSFTNVYFQ
jgi:hypothetical protein